MNRFITWLREWRGLQGRLWVALDEQVELRKRTLAAEGELLKLKTEYANLRNQLYKSEESQRRMLKIFEEVRRLLNPAKPVAASELRELQDDIRELLQPRRWRSEVIS